MGLNLASSCLNLLECCIEMYTTAPGRFILLCSVSYQGSSHLYQPLGTPIATKDRSTTLSDSPITPVSPGSLVTMTTIPELREKSPTSQGNGCFNAENVNCARISLNMFCVKRSVRHSVCVPQGGATLQASSVSRD